jgi:hypothetical protein
MWSLLGNLLSKSKTLNALLGDVVFTTPQEHGAYAYSFFEWRVKRSIDNRQAYVGVMMKADGGVGTQGNMTHYISFDLEAAVRLRDNLNKCIEFARRHSEPAGQPSSVQDS